MQALSRMVSPAVIFGGRIADFQGELFPGEALRIASAVEKRRREFAAGRTLARKALAACGGPLCEIGAGTRGEALWPEGFRGSISHSRELCYAVCAPASTCRALGLDIEQTGRVGRKLWKMFLASVERDQIAEAADPDLSATVAFCAKEAFQKAQFSVSGRVMELKSMCVCTDASGSGTLRIEQNAGSGFEALPGEVSGRWMAFNGHVAAFCMFQ